MTSKKQYNECPNSCGCVGCVITQLSVIEHSNEFGDFVVVDFFQWIFQSMFMVTMVLIVILPLNFP
jgi:hypothetical protein